MNYSRLSKGEFGLSKCLVQRTQAIEEYQMKNKMKTLNARYGNTKEVKKLMDCSICTARKERNQKVRGIAFSAIKAAFATTFQLVMSIVAVWYLITEGVML